MTSLFTQGTPSHLTAEKVIVFSGDTACCTGLSAESRRWGVHFTQQFLLIFVPKRPIAGRMGSVAQKGTENKNDAFAEWVLSNMPCFGVKGLCVCFKFSRKLKGDLNTFTCTIWAPRIPKIYLFYCGFGRGFQFYELCRLTFDFKKRGNL